MSFLGSVETCIVSDIEIDRNQRSEELLKLGGGQKFIFSYRGTCPMKEGIF